MSPEERIKELNEGWLAGYQNLKKDFDAKCVELAALRAENAKLIEVSKIVSQDAKDFQRKYDAALQLAQEYKEQSDKQKTQIAELLKKYEK